MTTDYELNLKLKFQKNSHIKFWIKSCRDQYLRALRIVGPFCNNELKEDWYSLYDFKESMYPIELMSQYYEILLTRYKDEISKSDFVSQKDIFDPFYGIKVWEDYFTEILIPELLKDEDYIRWTLMLVGKLKDENKMTTSKKLIESMQQFNMPRSAF